MRPVKSPMATTEPSPDLSPKSQAILDAAERLFVRYGYRKSSMDDVAREAGIAKGTVYLYYAGKEALFRALLERTGANVLQASETAAHAPLPFEDRLFGVLNAFYGYFYERFSDSGHLQELGEIRGSLGQDLTEQLRQNHWQILVDLLGRAEAEGEVGLSQRALTPQDVAMTLIAAASGAKVMLAPGAGIKAYADALKRTSHVFAAALSPNT